MAKFSSVSAFFLVGGYSLLGMKLQTLSHKTESITEPTHGLGDTAEAHTPVGVSRVTVAQGGGFFDAADGSYEMLAENAPSGPSAVARVAVLGIEGHTVGAGFFGLSGLYSHVFDVISQLGALVKANAEHVIQGVREEGVVLQPLETKTADWNTEATSYDGGAQSSSGGAGYLQVTAASGFTNFVGKIRDSADDNTFADLVTFTDNVSAPFAQRVVVAGTVERFLCFDGNVTGTGSITAWAGFVRY